MEHMDGQIMEFMALAELNGKVCHLKHSPSSNNENHPAIDYLCQNFGDMGVVIDSQVRIPICAECATALHGKEWLLFYCMGCNSSQWLLKNAARRHYDEDTAVMWMKACPTCYTKSDYEKD